MEFLKTWIGGIAISGMISGVVIMLIPKSNFQKQIKAIISVFLILSVCYPFLNYKDGIDISKLQNFKIQEEKNYEKLLLETVDFAENNLETKLKKAIIEKGLQCDGVEAEIKGSKDGFSLVKLTIFTDSETADIKSFLVNYYSVDGNIISVRKGE